MNAGMSFMTSPSIHSQCPTPISVQQSLLNPFLPQRCDELSHLLQELSFKEMQGVFPLLLEHIFGFGNHSGWGLKSIVRSLVSRDFDAVRSFLSPEGPLLCAAYKLLSDTHSRFEFPTSCLPLSTQSKIEEGTSSNLFNNKVPYGPGRPITHVLLNAFEYYFFHFTYLVVNPTQQKNVSYSANPTDVLYSCLLEDYLRYFLPVDGGSVPSMPYLAHTSSPTISSFTSNYTSPTNPGLSPNTSYLSMMYSSPLPPTHSSVTPHPSPSQTILKKNPALLKTMPISPISAASSSMGNSSSDHSRAEIWRTDVLVMILVEFWLSMGGAEARKTSFTVGSPDTFVPSHEHMKVARIFIKHLHYFVNSAKPAIKAAWNLPAQQTPLDEYKNSVLKGLVQKKLYHFLRLSFERWPLDATFRLPLETWLSYIQPWRYVDPFSMNQSTRKDLEETEKAFDPTWQKFVSENLLFYTVVFQHLLPRFFRMDLTSPKNSYMLFRVTKVFAQENLNSMIEEAERTLQGPAPSWLNTSAMHSGAVSPPSHTPTIAGALRQHIGDLEGPGFVYTPLFSSAVRNKVSDLLGRLSKARSDMSNILKEQESKKRGWFRDFVASIFLGDMFYPSEDYTTADCRKVILHLSLSASQLCSLLGISPDVTRVEETSSSTPGRSTGPDFSMDRDGPHLTPLGRHQLMNGLFKANVEYRGNPDLQPIRSYEVAFLVRLLHHFSSHINEKYAVEIGSLYTRHDWLGRLCRQLLAPPVTCSKLIKNGTMTSFKRQTEILPPRVSLRILANQQVLGYLMGLSLVAYVWGYGPFTYLLFLASMLFMYVVMKAAFTTTDHRSL